MCNNCHNCSHCNTKRSYENGDIVVKKSCDAGAADYMKSFFDVVSNSDINQILLLDINVDCGSFSPLDHTSMLSNMSGMIDDLLNVVDKAKPKCDDVQQIPINEELYRQNVERSNVRKTTIEKYHDTLDDLGRVFSRIIERNGEWSDDYTLWLTDFEAWVVEDMAYIVEKYECCLDSSDESKTNELNRLRDDVNKWIYYNIDVANIGIKYINLRAWLMGCPRMNKVDIQRLYDLKKAYEDAERKAVSEFGKIDTNQQPEHLRNIGK